MPAELSKPEIIHRIALKACREPVSIRDEIEEILRSNGMNARAATKEANRLRNPVELAIDQHLQTFEGRQVKTYFQRDASRQHRVGPSPHAGDFKWTARVQALLMKMPAGKFELLLGNLFVGLEFAEVGVTPMSGDGGVDFVGKVDLGRRAPDPGAITGPSPLAGQSIYAFGQAKRYSMSHPVETKEVDALIGSARGLVRGGGTAVKDRMIRSLTEWGWDANSNLIPMFATSGWFRSSIPGYARTQKFSIFDGEQLAQRVISSARPVRTFQGLRNAIRRLATSPLDHVTMLG